MTIELLAALMPMASVFLLLQATRWDRDSEPTPATVFIALAIGLGLAVSSCTYFLSLLLFDGTRPAVIAIDVTLLLLAAAAAWQRRRPRSTSVRQAFSWHDRLLAVAVALSALAAAVAFFINTLDDPHGQWDAWMTWNLRARALIRAGSEWWTIFARPTVHGDYPLLVPNAIARIWVYGGTDDARVPAALAAVWAVALVLSLYAALLTVRGRTTALLGALSLLGTPLFIRSIAWQYADIPLAFCLLAALALIAIHDHRPNCGGSALAWAGFAAGMAAWTKNEGMLFLVVVVAARALLALVRREPIRAAAAWFAVGLLPAAAVVLTFKIVLATPSYLVNQPKAQMLTRMADSKRYPVIARAIGFEGSRGVGALLLGLALYLALLGRARDLRARRAGSSAALVVALMALGYVWVYAVTPARLSWLLGHSVDRLLLHLWPSALLAFFLYAGSPAELAAPVPAVVAEPRRARVAAPTPVRSSAAGARRG